MGHKQSKLNPTDFTDLMEQTQFSEGDLVEYEKEFTKRYPKGKITREEMKREYKKIFVDGDPQPFVNQLFSIYDTDKNGLIDFREFICGIGLMSRGDIEQKLKIAFRTYDLDNSGYISRWEMQSVVTAIYKVVAPLHDKRGNKVPASAANAIFKSMDKDKDDQVSFEEFTAAVHKDTDVVRLLESIIR